MTTKFFTITAAALLMASAYSTASLAQVSDACMRQAEEACGREPIVECLARQDMMLRVDQICEGDFQAMIEMAREAQDEAFENNAQRASQDDTITGVSYGGVLRSGPGMKFGKVASLQEGDPVDIIEDTGVWFNEYKWYKVSTHRGHGYHWGGIFCVNLDTQIEGIFGKCN